jgi:hypothetical protein
MEIQITKEGVFIPSFNKNNELTKTDQVTVRYRMPTVAIKNRCRRKPQAKALASASGGIDHMEIVIEKDEISTLNEMLISISNCRYGSEGNYQSITNAQDLINAPVVFEPLLKEIVTEFDRILDHTGVDEKN